MEKQEGLFYDVEIPAPDLPSGNEVMAGITLICYTQNTETELDIAGLKVNEPVNDRFPGAVDYESCRLHGK